MIFRKNSAAGPKEILILKIQMAFCVQFVASTSNININALHSMSSQTAIPFSFLQGYCSKTAEEEEEEEEKKCQIMRFLRLVFLLGFPADKTMLVCGVRKVFEHTWFGLGLTCSTE